MSVGTIIALAVLALAVAAATVVWAIVRIHVREREAKMANMNAMSAIQIAQAWQNVEAREFNARQQRLGITSGGASEEAKLDEFIKPEVVKQPRDMTGYELDAELQDLIKRSRSEILTHMEEARLILLQTERRRRS